MNMINDVAAFMRAGEQSTDGLNVRQYALYTGLQTKKMADKLYMLGFYDFADFLEQLGLGFQEGNYDEYLRERVSFYILGADIDIAWSSIGAMFSYASSPAEAWKEVARSNMSKVDPATGKMVKDENGKVVKPTHYSKPELARFLPNGGK